MPPRVVGHTGTVIDDSRGLSRLPIVIAGLVAAGLVAAGVVALGATMLAAVRAGHHTGPPSDNYVAVQDVSAVSPAPVPLGPDASTGSFTSACGRNENGHVNADNFVAAPGVPAGAHHTHDYVGNVSTDAYSTEQRLAAADTTCANGDRSSYYWPVLRLLDGRAPDHDAPGGGRHGNTGLIQRPDAVSVQFLGSPVSKVVPMPRFLRLGTGDPLAFTDGGGKARAQWGCEGFPDRVTSRYPICPEHSRVIRTFEFPSCWDGLRTDSPDHQRHVLFPAATGACPAATFPVARLRIAVAYRLPAAHRFAVDSFPEQRRSPLTDHAFFVNAMPDSLMDTVTRCINQGRAC